MNFYSIRSVPYQHIHIHLQRIKDPMNIRRKILRFYLKIFIAENETKKWEKPKKTSEIIKLKSISPKNWFANFYVSHKESFAEIYINADEIKVKKRNSIQNFCWNPIPTNARAGNKQKNGIFGIKFIWIHLTHNSLWAGQIGWASHSSFFVFIFHRNFAMNENVFPKRNSRPLPINFSKYIYK